MKTTELPSSGPLPHQPRTAPLQVGDTVWECGYEFRVTEVYCTEALPNGRTRAYFRGACTENTANDGIRGTAYDGGNYGPVFYPTPTE